MSGFWENLKLYQSHTIEINIEREEFVKRLKQNVSPKRGPFLFQFFDVLSPEIKTYEGVVKEESFEIRKPFNYFLINSPTALITGKLKQKEETLVIDLEVSGVINMFLLPMILFPFFCLAVIIGSFSGNLRTDSIMGVFSLLFTLPIIVIPYLIMKQMTQLTIYDVERELFYIAKRKLNKQ